MQFFHWTGLTYSQMCFLCFTCECVNMLDYCVNVCVSVCPKIESMC